MFSYNRFLFLVFVLVCSHTIHAQQPACSLTVQGHISINDSAKLAANAASVFAPKLKKGVYADSAGNFIITNVCPGKLELIVTYLGYKNIDTMLRITKDNTVLNFQLVNNADQLNSVTVTGEIIHKDQISTAVKTTLSGKELEQTRGLSLGESLKSITGVNSLQSGPSVSKPIIHGVYSNRILIVNNGIRQEGQNWGNDHAPEIDPFIATKITVIKGAASIRYGSDAIGGVILLDPKEMRKDAGIDGELNLVGMTNGRVKVGSGMIEGAAGKKLEGLSWRLQGTLKQAGSAQAAHYYMNNTGFHEDDYSATLKYAKPKYGAEIYFSRFDTKIGVAAASHIGTYQDFISAFYRATPAVTGGYTDTIGRPYQTVNHELIKASAFVNLGNNMGKIEATYAFQHDVRKEYDADISFNDSLARLNPPDLYFRLNTSTTNLVWQHPAIKKKIVGSVGVDFLSQGNLQEGTGYQELIPNFVQYGGGLFVIEKYELNKLVLEAGARYDYRWLQAYTIDSRTLLEEKPTYNWQNVTFNAGATYRFSEKFSGVFNFGTAWRPPQVIELFADGIHQSAASWENGDTALTLEKAYNSSLAVKYNSTNFEGELGVYANYFNGYIYLKPDSIGRTTIQGYFPSYTYTQVKNALFKGIDFNFTYSFLKNFSLISKTTIVRARDVDAHQWLISIPADRFDNTLKYSLPSWGGVKDFFISINNLVVAMQTRMPAPPSNDKIYPDYITPPGYMLWGADAGCSFFVAKQKISTSLSVTNLTNVDYRDYLNRFRFFIGDLGRNVSLRIVVLLDGRPKKN